MQPLKAPTPDGYPSRHGIPVTIEQSREALALIETVTSELREQIADLDRQPAAIPPPDTA